MPRVVHVKTIYTVRPITYSEPRLSHGKSQREPNQTVMLSGMKFGLFVPPFYALADPERLVSIGVDAEEAGWDGLFLWDHMLAGDGTPIADPWITMAGIACATTRIRLGAMVTPLSRRRPWVMARQIATLDLLSRGRLVVGVGLGDDGWQEFSGFGEVVDARARGRLLDQSLALLQQLLTGRPTVLDEGDIRVSTSPFLPLPIQQPLPLWAAGRWPRRRPLERAAKVQGFFPIFPPATARQPPEQAELLEIHRELEQRGADDGFDLVVTWPFSTGVQAGVTSATVERMDEAGVTWILQGFEPTPSALEGVAAAVRRGPPGR
ncbi:MAG TPA: LLM class flavin-dependent oxidoreductase [Candidatus Dormibacteraeota bacterium]|nr:LLM class flavin-dependent oxidoreductase [Candidatus Dormibacteraeota bacterium]